MRTEGSRNPSVFARRALLVFALALLVRLFILPFSMTTEADVAVWVTQTEHWLQHPSLVPHEAWPPLQYYLIAIALLVGKDPVLAPIVLSMILSSATAVALYALVRREWEEVPALFVAGAWMFYPVSLHYSVMAVSENSFVFLVALSMLELSKARDNDGGLRAALWAGLWLTLAGAIRFEGWVLIPLFGLLLWKKRTLLFAFLAVAALFPVAWMLRCYIQWGHPLYPVVSTAHYGVLSGINEGLTFHKQLKRAFYLPQVLFFGLTPLVSLMCIAGMLFQITRKNRQRAWLIPCVGMSLVMVEEFVKGRLLVILPRYSIVVGLLALPFAAEAYKEIVAKLRRPSMVSVFIIASMIPFSYLRHVNSHVVAMAVPPNIEAVPRISQRAQSISRALNRQIRPGSDGVILDWWNWSETGYVSLMTRMSFDRIYKMPGAVHQPLDTEALAAFLNRNKSGVVLVAPQSRHIEIVRLEGHDVLKFRGFQRELRLNKLSAEDGFVMYRYTTDDPGSR